jgi:uncharacterized membrane protein YjgN (DUF898 family)
MTEEKESSYPNNAQSWGIAGLIVLSMVLFSPVSLMLNNIAGKNISLLIYYLLAMGFPFLIAHHQRKKRISVSGYKFDFSSPKIMVLVSFTIIGIQAGIISPIVSLIPMPEFMKKIFLDLAKTVASFHSSPLYLLHLS